MWLAVLDHTRHLITCPLKQCTRVQIQEDRRSLDQYSVSCPLEYSPNFGLVEFSELENCIHFCYI